MATFFVVAFFLPIELEQRSLLDGKVEILLPKGWKPMSEDLVKIKYPGAKPPKLVYSDVSGAISIAFNLTESNASQSTIEKYHEVLKQSLEKAYPDAVWEETTIREINGKRMGEFRLITDTYNDKIYNQMLFTDLNGKLLICSFNCVETKLKTWKPIAADIMNSLTIK